MYHYLAIIEALKGWENWFEGRFLLKGWVAYSIAFRVEKQASESVWALAHLLLLSNSYVAVQ